MEELQFAFFFEIESISYITRDKSSHLMKSKLLHYVL